MTKDKKPIRKDIKKPEIEQKEPNSAYNTKNYSKPTEEQIEAILKKAYITETGGTDREFIGIYKPSVNYKKDYKLVEEGFKAGQNYESRKWDNEDKANLLIEEDKEAFRYLGGKP